MTFFWLPHEWSLKDCEILRANAIFDPGQRRTHVEGGDQSISSLQGVTQGKEREKAKKKPERSRKSLSSLLSQCHTLRPLSVTISLCCPWASGGWHSASPSIHPSIHLSLLQLIPTYTSTFSLSFTQSFFNLSTPRGFSSCSLHHGSPSTPFLPVQSYWFWPEALGCPLFPFQPNPHPVPGSRTRSSSCSEEQWKTLTSVRNQSLMNDWCTSADSSHRR